MMFKFSLILLAVLAGGFGCQHQPPHAASPPTDNELLVAAPATAPATQPSPTDVYRALFIAMLNSDRAGVEAVIVPHPDAEVLWTGNRLTNQQRLQILNAVRLGLTMYEVKPGTLVELPGNRELYLTEDMVDQNRKLYWPMLAMQKMPTPVWIQRSPGGAWKVDAGPLIAGRKKAKEVLATRPYLAGSTRPAAD